MYIICSQLYSDEECGSTYRQRKAKRDIIIKWFLMMIIMMMMKLEILYLCIILYRMEMNIRKNNQPKSNHNFNFWKLYLIVLWSCKDGSIELFFMRLMVFFRCF
jgi:hypothetical protein